VITGETLNQKREEIRSIARRHGAHDIRISGSVARGDAVEPSVLDLIVRFEQDRSLPDHGGRIMDPQELLGVGVDVISEAGMRERVRDHVLKEAIPPARPGRLTLENMPGAIDEVIECAPETRGIFDTAFPLVAADPDHRRGGLAVVGVP
jgi:predicted nucleotidyltransferase